MSWYQKSHFEAIVGISEKLKFKALTNSRQSVFAIAGIKDY